MTPETNLNSLKRTKAYYESEIERIEQYLENAERISHRYSILSSGQARMACLISQAFLDSHGDVPIREKDIVIKLLYEFELKYYDNYEGVEKFFKDFPDYNDIIDLYNELHISSYIKEYTGYWPFFDCPFEDYIDKEKYVK